MLDKIRVNYEQKHRRLMTGGFGCGYDFERKRLKLDKPKFLMIKLEMIDE